MDVRGVARDEEATRAIPIVLATRVRESRQPPLVPHRQIYAEHAPRAATPCGTPRWGAPDADGVVHHERAEG
jgi:hypothetical protein